MLYAIDEEFMVRETVLRSERVVLRCFDFCVSVSSSILEGNRWRSIKS